MAYVTVINEHAHVQQIVSGHHHLTADEPVAAGGSDAGFAARELLLASLGACTAVACRRHAAQHSWNVGKITVGVRWSRAADGREHIRTAGVVRAAARCGTEVAAAAGGRRVADRRRPACRDQYPVGHHRLKRAYFMRCAPMATSVRSRVPTSTSTRPEFTSAHGSGTLSGCTVIT